MIKVKFMKKKYIFIGIFIVVVGFLIYLWQQQPQPGEIPTEYQPLYSELEGKLDEFDKYLESLPDKEDYPTIFAADFLVANGNRGKGLFDEKAYPYVLSYLDALVSLGVKGVKITINYPLLVSDFPDSEKYLDFYRKVAVEIKEKRGLKLLIQATAMFTQKEFADLSLRPQDYYQRLTLETYVQGKIEHIQKIIDVVQPDYLYVETEPDTMARNTGLQELNDPKIYKQVVEEQIKDLKRGRTLIGAGVGTWNKKEFVEELLTLPELDFLELRIYPLDFFPNAISYTEMAKARGKKVIFGESWLYKLSTAELKEGEGAAWAKIISRDVYSFWQPLDQKFLEVFVKLARSQGIEFISPFWSNYFFAYLDYDLTTRFRSPGSLLKLTQKQAVKRLTRQELSSTGLKYQELIAK